MSADLFEQHRHLIALTEELRTLVCRRPYVSIEEIAQLRAHLGKTGVAHLRAEDELIMRPLLASGRADEVPEAMAVIGEIRAAMSYYGQHANRWTMAAVDADRDGYAEALGQLIDFMRNAMAREETELYAPVLALLRSNATPFLH